MSGPTIGKKPKRNMQHADAEIDLVPMIDCVFLMLLFFMLCGRISMDQRTEQITVPPTKTAQKLKEPPEWTREIVNVFGSTQHGDPPRNSIRLGNKEWKAQGVNDYSAYKGLRAALDGVYDKAEKYDDPKTKGLMKLPKVVIEIRADADTEYRVVQEIQQVLTDTMDLETMQPKKNVDPKSARAFVNVDFTTRNPNDK
jgi:biopolymer transport protein ExbD